MIFWFVILFCSLVLSALLFERFVKWVAYRNRVVAFSIDAESTSQYKIGGPGYLALERLIQNPNIQVVSIQVGSLMMGWADIQSLRGQIKRLRDSNKIVWVYLLNMERGALYLASAADKIHMLPTGALLWMGVGRSVSFYGAFLSKLGLKADVERMGNFKGAAEPFTHERPSEEFKQQQESLFASLQDQLLEGVAQGRSIEKDTLKSLLDQSPFSAAQAKEHGLVDELVYEDQYEKSLKDFTSSKIMHLYSFDWYLRWQESIAGWFKKKPKIALLYLTGAIYEEKRSGNAIVANVVSDQLLALAEIPSIKGVVLVVDSPGGSAQASERIARAVELLGRKKPTVAFMSSVAASGGYYFSAVAHEIIALPGTITGSIGVVGGKIVVGQAAKQWGIHSEVMEAGPDSDFFSPMSSFSSSQRERFRSFLEVTYKRFLMVVSGGRGVPVQAIEEVAGGRVWTGEQALEHQLVDKLGDLNVAIQRVALKANLSNYRLVHVRKRPPLLARLRKSLLPVSLLDRKLPESLQLLKVYPMQPLTFLEEFEDYFP